jgi:hypothetical protein
MRKLTSMTGLELGAGMEEALRRMERGEDPDQIEAEMGDILESEDPFQMAAKKGVRSTGRSAPGMTISSMIYDYDQVTVRSARESGNMNEQREPDGLRTISGQLDRMVPITAR